MKHDLDDSLALPATANHESTVLQCHRFSGNRSIHVQYCAVLLAGIIGAMVPRFPSSYPRTVAPMQSYYSPPPAVSRGDQQNLTKHQVLEKFSRLQQHAGRRRQRLTIGLSSQTVVSVFGGCGIWVLTRQRRVPGPSAECLVNHSSCSCVQPEPPF